MSDEMIRIYHSWRYWMATICEKYTEKKKPINVTHVHSAQCKSKYIFENRNPNKTQSIFIQSSGVWSVELER